MVEYKTMKNVLSLCALTLMTACSVTPESAYESGWNLKKSEGTYKECAMTWLKKDMFMAQNMDRLITLGYLTKEQAIRAAKSEVRVGDPECLAFAAFGLTRGSKLSFVNDSNKNLLERELNYSCKESNATCPGVSITIENGVVSSVYSLPKT